MLIALLKLYRFWPILFIKTPNVHSGKCIGRKGRESHLLRLSFKIDYVSAERASLFFQDLLNCSKIFCCHFFIPGGPRPLRPLCFAARHLMAASPLPIVLLIQVKGRVRLVGQIRKSFKRGRRNQHHSFSKLFPLLKSSAKTEMYTFVKIWIIQFDINSRYQRFWKTREFFLAGHFRRTTLNFMGQICSKCVKRSIIKWPSSKTLC